MKMKYPQSNGSSEVHDIINPIHSGRLVGRFVSLEESCIIWKECGQRAEMEMGLSSVSRSCGLVFLWRSGTRPGLYRSRIREQAPHRAPGQHRSSPICGALSSRIWSRQLERLRINRVDWTKEFVSSRPMSYSIVSAKIHLQAREAFRIRLGVSFCRRRISTFISKFVANENVERFWGRYSHGGLIRILLMPAFICCATEKNCKPLPPTDWENSISSRCRKAH